MASYQKLVIVGNLGGDPEARYLSNGDAVASFSVGVSEQWKDANGERKDKTEWFRCVAFKRQAEIATEYLRKGAQVLVEGRIQTRSYESKDGITKYVTEVRVDAFKMLGARAESEQPRNPSTGGQRQPRTNQRQQPQQPSGGFDDDDGDIPF